MKIVPYDLFVKFLITKGHFTLEEVNAQLRKFRLNPITRQIFERHYVSVKTIVPAPIFDQMEKRNPLGSSFLRWVDELGVKQLWESEPKFKTPESAKHWTIVFDILQDPLLKFALNAMLIKGAGGEELANSLNAKFSALLNKTHLETYRKFFWNPAIMTRADWRDYISQSSIGNTEKDILFICLSETTEVVRTRVGLPASIQTSETLQMMAQEAILKYKHYVRLSTKDADVSARYWGGVAKDLIAQYEKFKAADLRDFSKELQMQFEYIETDFETPDEATLKEVKEKDPMAEAKEAGEGSPEDTENDNNPQQQSLDV